MGLALVQIWVFMIAVMGAAWLRQKATGNAGIVDLAWTAGVGAGIVWVCLGGDAPVARRWLIAILGGFWSVRLSAYIWRDRIRHRSEDARYASLRKRWGERANGRFLLFFQLQALLVPLFVLPAAIGAYHSLPTLTVFDGLGVVVFLCSICGETIADLQLERFRSDPSNRGTTCRNGLWRYSRHPNYFFEWLHWWAYPCFAAASPLWIWTLVGPLLMLFFLFRVTGIPATEARALQSRGDDYRVYQASTSVFIPWFPKEDKSSP